MKKILHISKYYSPYNGGVEDVCKSLVDGTPEYKRKVLCFNDSKHDSTDLVDGVEIIRKGIWKEVCRQPMSLGFPRLLRKTLREYSPDIVHVHVPNPLVSLLVCLFVPKSTKIVIHWHSDIIVHSFIYALFKPIENWSLKRADKIITTSPNYLEGSKPLLPFKDKCVIVPNVVSLDKLLSAESEQAKISAIRERYDNKPIVFFMGRHVGYKGIEMLIKAEQFLQSDCKILIAGSGPLTNSLKEIANGKERIEFIGRIPDEDITSYMRAATVFAFPSITKNEAFGVVLAEAMYCGTPPVCFKIPDSGVNWVSVKDETGFEIENGNVEAYAKALDILINDTTTRTRFSVAAKRRVERMFVLDAIKPQLAKVYE